MSSSSLGFSRSASILLNTARAGAPVFFKRSSAWASSPRGGASASTTHSAKSGEAAAARTASIIRLFRKFAALWIPGVSMKTICASFVVSTPWMVVRVVCGLEATIASLLPVSALSSVDFPAFGRPRIAANTERYPAGSPAPLSFPIRRLGHAHLIHAKVIRRQHLDRDAVPFGFLARFGNVTQPLRHQPADRRGDRKSVV